jgi:hypothetical protein
VDRILLRTPALFQLGRKPAIGPSDLEDDGGETRRVVLLLVGRWLPLVVVREAELQVEVAGERGEDSDVEMLVGVAGIVRLLEAASGPGSEQEPQRADGGGTSEEVSKPPLCMVQPQKGNETAAHLPPRDVETPDRVLATRVRATRRPPSRSR